MSNRFDYDDFENWSENRDTENEHEKDIFLEKNIWFTSDGDEIHITELEDSHLDNIITWLEDNEFYLKEEWLELLEEERDDRIVDMFSD